MFWRIRCLVWQIVARVDPAHRGGLLKSIVHEGAHCEAAHALIDRIATLDGIAAINGGALNDRAATWGIALRACESVWIFGDLFPHAHVPLAVPDVPEEVGRQLLAAMMPGADPAAFSLAASSHPASLLWALRLMVQRAMLDGSFAQVAPAVAKFADALGNTELRLDAVMLYLFAGNSVEARRRLEVLPGPQAEMLRLMLTLVDGPASEAIPILAPLVADDHALCFPLATALAESGRYADALELARHVIDDEPGNALALALAARCAWALGETRAGNAYAKVAARLGQPVKRPAARRRRGGRARRSSLAVVARRLRAHRPRWRPQARADARTRPTAGRGRAELELDHEHAGELGRAGDRRRPGDQPPSSSSTTSMPASSAAPAIAADLVTSRRARPRACRRARPRRRSPPTW